MFIRNKGTAAAPRFALVENRRLRGVSSPSQKVICYLGRHDNFEDAIKFWKIVLRDWKRFERKASRWPEIRSKPLDELLKKYAKREGTSKIQSRISNLKRCASRLRHHQKISDLSKIRKNSIRDAGETSKSMRLKLKIESVSKLVNKIKRDGDDKAWNPAIRAGIKSLLKDIIDFESSL